MKAKQRRQLLKVNVPFPRMKEMPPYKATKQVKHGSSMITETYTNITYNAVIDSSTGEDILIIRFFRPDKSPLYTLFQKQKEDYFFYDFETKKERFGSIGNVLGLWYCHRKKFHATKAAVARICKYIDVSKLLCPIGALRTLHDKILEQRLAVKDQRHIDQVNEQMREIKKIPQDVYRWVNASVMKDSRYIKYVYSGRKSQDGYCSHCKTAVRVTDAKHLGTGICPKCRSHITYLADGKFSGRADEGWFYYIQPAADGFVEREFRIKRIHKNIKNELSSSWEEYYHEVSRVFWKYDGVFEKTKIFVWDTYKNRIDMFCEVAHTYVVHHQIYPNNLNKQLRRNKYTQYTDFNQIARKCGKLDIGEIYAESIRTPQVEFLMKLGLYEIAGDVLRGKNAGFNRSENNIKKFLGVSKDDLSLLKKHNFSLNGLQVFNFVKRLVGKPDVRKTQWIINNNLSLRDITVICRYTTLHKLMRYLSERSPSNRKARYFLSDWKDYILAATGLGWDMKSSFVIFPKHFVQAHDEATEEWARVKRTGENPNDITVQQMEKQLNGKFAFENKTLLIRAPHNANEIREEGKALRHCVGGYVSSVISGDSYVFFIRKKNEPDKPYFTLELDSDDFNIVQCRGYRNCGYDDEVSKFLEQWKSKFLCSASMIQWILMAG